MFRSSWFHKLLGLRRSRSDRRRQAAQERRVIRPFLEELEDRLCPSPLPFPNPANGAELQQDINFANANPATKFTITLTATDTYQLSSDQAVSNTAGLTIDGAGATINAA